METKLNPKTDEIERVVTNEKGQVQTIFFKDGERLTFSDFIELFKVNLRTVVAGEIVTWEDVWRFTKQTDAKSFEMYLDNVEAEGILKGSRLSLNRQQKTNLLMFLVIVICGIVAAGLLYLVFSKGIRF